MSQTGVDFFIKCISDYENKMWYISLFLVNGYHQNLSVCLQQVFSCTSVGSKAVESRRELSSPLSSHSHKAKRNGSSTFLLCLNLFLFSIVYPPVL